MSSSYPRPVIFLGYVVTKPLASRRRCLDLTFAFHALRFLSAAPYEIMVADGRVHDIDEEDWDRW